MKAVALILAAFVAIGPCAAQTLTISCRTDTDVAFGEVSRLVVTEAFRRAGIGLILKPLPMVRAIEEANDGLIDGDWTRIADVVAQYPNLLIVPTPVNRFTIAVYGRTSAITTMTRAEISKLKIGYQRGFFLVRKHTRGMNTSEGGLSAETFAMLANGRVEALMTEYTAAEGMFREPGAMPKPPMWPYAWATEPAYLILNKRNAALVPRLDAALRQMKREGLIERVYGDVTRSFDIPPLLSDVKSGAEFESNRR